MNPRLCFCGCGESTFCPLFISKGHAREPELPQKGLDLSQRSAFRHLSGMSVTTVVETTNNPVLEPKGVSPLKGSSVGVLWLDSSTISASTNDRFPETKVTESQYWEINLEGDLDLGSKQKILEVIHMSNWQIPTLFTLCGVTFFAIAGYFLIQNVFDLGVASLGPGVTAALAAIFSKMAGRTKK